MRGSKKCSCGITNLVAAKKCICGKTFAMKKQRVIYSKPKKGRKKCPCGLYMSNRTKKCPVCSYEFKKDRTKRVFHPMFKVGIMIDTPKGKCPFILHNYDRESVVDWAIKIYNRFKDTYTNKAIKYWLRYYLTIDTYEYNNACKYIDEWWECQGLLKKEPEKNLNVETHTVTSVEENLPYHQNFIRIRK